MFKIHFEAFLELFIKNIFYPTLSFLQRIKRTPYKNCEESSNPPTKTAKNLATPLGILLPPSGDYCTVPKVILVIRERMSISHIIFALGGGRFSDCVCIKGWIIR